MRESVIQVQRWAFWWASSFDLHKSVTNWKTCVAPYKPEGSSYHGFRSILAHFKITYPTHYPFSATYCIALNSSISDSQSNTRTQCARLAHAVITPQPRTQEDDSDWLALIDEYWWSWAQCSKLLRMDNALVIIILKCARIFLNLCKEIPVYKEQHKYWNSVHILNHLLRHVRVAVLNYFHIWSNYPDRAL
jgi:hypothetical protein